MVDIQLMIKDEGIAQEHIRKFDVLDRNLRSNLRGYMRQTIPICQCIFLHYFMGSYNHFCLVLRSLYSILTSSAVIEYYLMNNLAAE